MISSFRARLRSLWAGIRRREDIDAEMAEEFRLHQELRAEELIRSGVSPAEAARQARLEFGDAGRYRDEGRASRGLAVFDEIRFSWLDVKLSLRMLVRYPGLTAIAGLAMAFAIWVGAGTFELVTQALYPKIPLDEGDRIVGIQLWDMNSGGDETRSLFELESWAGKLRTIDQLGAFRDVERSLILGEDAGEPVRTAEISASAFALARVAPLHGRGLAPEDERADAPHVIVIGYDLWQSRFGADPAAVGQTVRLGSSYSTVVGVMPEGFGFPVSHTLWTPLKLSLLEFGPRDGPSVKLFGRLADGVTIEEAQAELSVLGAAEAAAMPETHEFIRPLVLPYASSMLDIPPGLRLEVSMAVLSANLIPIALLLLICGNVALLMFARAAARESELVVRTALGASRRRLITQLFVEALVLGAFATALGLAAATFGIRWALSIVQSNFLGGIALPFWIHAGLSSATILYAGGLTLLGALVAGVLPALKLTRGVGARLKAATAGGGGLRLGGIWTVVVICQVAVTVLFPAMALMTQSEGARDTGGELPFPSAEYVSLMLLMERDAPPGMSADSAQSLFLARYVNAYRALESRIAADPAVAGVTYAERLPRMYHPWNQIEVDQGAAPPPDELGHRVGSASVDPDYLDVLGTPVLSGRGFQESDLASGARVAIVNTAFVEDVLGGKNPVGARVRYIADESDREPRRDGPWYDIIGVSESLGTTSGYGDAGIYHPASPSGAYPLHMAVHVRGDLDDVTSRLRQAALQVDPALQLHQVMPLDQVVAAEVAFYRFWASLLFGISALAMLLSLAGIYAVTSFTVSRRTREIGIRLAMGAEPRSVVRAILARPVAQVGVGILIGGMLVGGLALGPGMVQEDLGARVALVLAYAAVMMGVCLLACIVPTRRVLRIQPTQALRAEG